MCSYDFEPVEFSSEEWRKARKSHRCYGCGRQIERGEHYARIVQKIAGEMVDFAECEHCKAASGWLQKACRGGFSADIVGEIREHASDPDHASLPLLRLAVYAKRTWRATRATGSPLVSPEVISALVARAPAAAKR